MDERDYPNPAAVIAVCLGNHFGTTPLHPAARDVLDALRYYSFVIVSDDEHSSLRHEVERLRELADDDALDWRHPTSFTAPTMCGTTVSLAPETAPLACALAYRHDGPHVDLHGTTFRLTVTDPSCCPVCLTDEPCDCPEKGDSET